MLATRLNSTRIPYKPEPNHCVATTTKCSTLASIKIALGSANSNFF